MCRGVPFHQQPLPRGLNLPISWSTGRGGLPWEALGRALPSLSLLAPGGSQPAAMLCRLPAIAPLLALGKQAWARLCVQSEQGAAGQA